MKRIIRPLASLKLAVFILLFLSILICIGTIVESRFDARTAKLLVYDSVWMYLVLGLLILNLIAVILDRFPWQARHLAFILAHVGIIVIIAGGWLTMKYGVDGTLRLLPGETSNQVILPEMLLTVYKSADGEQYQKIWEEPFEAVTAGFSQQRPMSIKLPDIDLLLTEAIPYGRPKMQVEASQFSQSGAGLRFLISNGNVSFTDWLVQRTVFEKVDHQSGPLKISFGGLWERQIDFNEIRLMPRSEGVEYSFYQKNETKPYKQGFSKEGESVVTAWMGLEFRILRYFPKASVKWEIEKMERPTPMTLAALRVQHQGVESWLVANDYLKIFTDKNVYLFSYMNKRVELPLKLELLDFQKTNYPGSMRAMAYKSHVSYQTSSGEKQEASIAMNEPLKASGYYFYQASFEENQSGQVQASILSVNQDPGRLLKYVGSLIMCLGTIMLFYFRKHYNFFKT